MPSRSDGNPAPKKSPSHEAARLALTAPPFFEFQRIYFSPKPMNEQDSVFHARWWCVYILRCENESLYGGCTHDLVDRICRHNLVQVVSTGDKLPVTLLGFTAFRVRYKAFAYER